MNTTTRTWLSLRMGLWVWVAVIGGSIALAPLVSSQFFLVPGSLTAAAVILCGALLRTWETPWPVVGVAQLVVLAEAVTLTYARDGATFGFVPDVDTLDALGTMTQATLAHAQEYPAPVPALHALNATLVLCMGVLAVAVDLLASSRRTVPLVGLLFLTVYMMPVSLLSGQVTMWAFIPGALGYVFLLAAAERLYAVGWGQHLSDLDRRASGVDTVSRGRGLTVTGRRAGFGAVACAVVLPLFIPTLSPQIFGEGGAGGPGDGSGGSDVTVDNPVLDLRRNLGRQSDAELVRVTDSSNPPTYLRLTALDELTEEGWLPGPRGRDSEPVDASLPDAPGTASGVVQTTVGGRVTLSEDFHTRWLPVVYAPRSISIDGSWRVDRENLDVIAGEKELDAAGTTYSFSSSVIEPTPEQMRRAPAAGRDLTPMMRVPTAMPQSIERRARAVTSDADNAFDKAMALQHWFRVDGGFQYDLSVRPDENGLEAIADFVDDDRRGYCEQFAGAMAMMARTLGIPARVAVGFLRPEREGQAFVFRGTDMHAWPELYFDGVGWVTFEPTPGGVGYDAADFSTTDDSIHPRAAAPQLGSRPTEQPRELGDTPSTAAGGDGGGDESSNYAAGAAAVVGVLLLLLAVPLTVRSAISRRRWRRATDGPALAEAAWAELGGRVRDLGGPWDPDATPRRVGHALAEQIADDEDAVGALELLVTQTERARFDRACDPPDLRDAVGQVTTSLAARSSRRRRLVARWLPTAWARGGLKVRRRGPEIESELIALRE